MQHTNPIDPSIGLPTPSSAPPAPTPDDHRFTTTRFTKFINLIGVVLPLLGLLAAILLLWGFAFNWVYLALLVGMYLVTTLGISVGYHRYFTHKSFDTPKPIAFLLGACGAMAAQGSVLEWVAVHRRHHQFSDDHDDPHSPHHSGNGPLGALRGLWHAHIGWLFHARPAGLARYVGDLRKDPMIRRVSDLFPLWMALGFLIPAAIGGLITMSWSGALLGLLWGGLVRIFLVHHITWSVNSVCHLWGSQDFHSHDESRNNAVFGILGFGEGWHNNHHAFPTSARHGLKWWQIDMSFWLIKAFAFFGLASNIRVPAPAALAAKSTRPHRGRHAHDLHSN